MVGELALGVYPPRLHVTAHVHLLLVGFMLMLVMGVATWMFPRPARDDARYRPELAAAVYWLMTAGTGVRAAPELLAPIEGGRALRLLIVLGGLAPVAGTCLLVVNTWWRVRMPTAPVAARPLTVRAAGRDVGPGLSGRCSPRPLAGRPP